MIKCKASGTFQYFKLAIIAGGSIHTVNDDLTNLSVLNEGDEFQIDSTVYHLKNGRIVPKRFL